MITDSHEIKDLCEARVITSLLNTLKRIENKNEGDYFAAFYRIKSAKLCLNQLPSATLGGRVCCAPFSSDPSPWYRY